jgi:excisionase family DNA binding protein
VTSVFSFEDMSTDNQNTPASDDQLWTSEQVAKYLHVSSKTIFNLRKNGLPYIKLGGAVRFVPEEVKDYLDINRGLARHRSRQIIREGENRNV